MQKQDEALKEIKDILRSFLEERITKLEYVSRIKEGEAWDEV